jgi:hypothetical protein
MSVVHGQLNLKDTKHPILLGYQQADRVIDAWRAARNADEPDFEVVDVDGEKHTIACDQFISVTQKV